MKSFLSRWPTTRGGRRGLASVSVLPSRHQQRLLQPIQNSVHPENSAHAGCFRKASSSRWSTVSNLRSWLFLRLRTCVAGQLIGAVAGDAKQAELALPSPWPTCWSSRCSTVSGQRTLALFRLRRRQTDQCGTAGVRRSMRPSGPRGRPEALCERTACSAPSISSERTAASGRA